MTPPDTVPADPPPAVGTATPMALADGFVLDAWYFVALSRDVAPAALKRHELLGEPVLVGRTRAGAVYAMRDICPHRAAPLSAGKLVARPGEGETIECPYHGWRFRPDGVCAAIPSLVEDEAVEITRIRVRTYPVRESQGMVFVWIARDGRDRNDPDHEPPIFPDLVGGAVHGVESMEVDSHIDHAVLGLLDPAHSPLISQRRWWPSARSGGEKAGTVEPREQGLAIVGHAPSSSAPATEICFRLPGYRWEHRRVGENQILALTCLTPVSETRTRITQMFWADPRVFAVAGLVLRTSVNARLRRDGGKMTLQDADLCPDPGLIGRDDANTPAKRYQQLKRDWPRNRAPG